MELEVSRVKLLETLERSKKTTLRIAVIGFSAIFFGVFLEDGLIADIGWAIATVSLLIWAGLIVSSRMLSPRIPYEMMEAED